MWQEIIVAICVLSSFAFLVYSYLPDTVLPKMKKKNATGCGGCNNCSSKKGCH